MAFLLDEALASRLLIDRLNGQVRRSRGVPPPGTRWASDAEQGVEDYAAALADSQAALETNGTGR